MSELPHAVGFFGECMIELKGAPEKGISHGYAGDSFNTALYFARLSQQAGLQAQYITAVGTDAFSQHMLEFWHSEQMGTQFVQSRCDKLPGIYSIHVDAAGERHFSYWRDQSAARFYFDATLNDQTFSELSQLKGFYLSGISLAILPEVGRSRLMELLKAIKANGGSVYFDNNYRPKLWPRPQVARDLYHEVLALTDIAFLTLDDEAALFDCPTAGDIFNRLADLPIGEIVIKQGKEPCVVKFDGGVSKIAAEVVAQPVDTTAAGDSFSAAYLACRLAGGSVIEATQAGHQLAAIVIQHEGAIISGSLMPNLISK